MPEGFPIVDFLRAVFYALSSRNAGGFLPSHFFILSFSLSFLRKVLAFKVQENSLVDIVVNRLFADLRFESKPQRFNFSDNGGGGISLFNNLFFYALQKRRHAFLGRRKTTTTWFTAQTPTKRRTLQSASAREKRAEHTSTFGFTKSNSLYRIESRDIDIVGYIKERDRQAAQTLRRKLNRVLNPQYEAKIKFFQQRFARSNIQSGRLGGILRFVHWERRFPRPFNGASSCH